MIITMLSCDQNHAWYITISESDFIYHIIFYEAHMQISKCLV